MKNCKDCDNNYLLELFNRCLDKHEIYNDALEEFNALCTRCKDPRSSVMILYNLLNNDCEVCEKYKDLYKSHIT